MGREGDVTRYSKIWTEIQNIMRDNKGQGLYELPHYITENINSDVCVLDWRKQAKLRRAKVLLYKGKHYTGRK